MKTFIEVVAGSERDAQTWIEGFAQSLHTTAMGPLGAELVAIDDHHAAVEISITDAARQPFGLLHGGVSMLLAEPAASMHAAWCADLTQVAPVGVEINGTHLRSAREGRVRATATVIRKTRSMIFHDIQITHLDTDELLCVGRVTNFLKPHAR